MRHESRASVAHSAPAGLPLVVRYVARGISVGGHPLVLVPLFVGAYSFRHYPPGQAALLTGAVLGGVVLPLTVWNLRRVRQGRYTNFDVSDRRQRRSMYPVLLLAMGTVSALGWGTHQPRPLTLGLSVAWLMVAGASLINRWFKCSLHAAMAFFLGGALVVLIGPAGGWALLLAALVGTSRVVLGRHSAAEVAVGGGLGLGAAALAWALL